jgi:hypothetical protein
LHDRQPPTIHTISVNEIANLTRDDALLLFKDNVDQNNNDTVVVVSALSENATTISNNQLFKTSSSNSTSAEEDEDKKNISKRTPRALGKRHFRTVSFTN